MNMGFVYCFDALEGHTEPGVYFSPVFGHRFGFTASVTNFCSVPALICSVARRVLAVPMEAYIDDSNIPDLHFPGMGGDSGGQRAAVELYRIFCWPIEATKSSGLGEEEKFLGMISDTSRVSSLMRPAGTWSPGIRIWQTTIMSSRTCARNC